MAEQTGHWGQRLRTWLVVTLITVLVWLYAEGQAISQRSEQLMVTFVAPGQNVAIEPKTPFGTDPPVRITATFRGSTGQLAQVRRVIEEGPIELEVSGRTENGSGEQNIVVRDALLNSRLGEMGVNIVETTPPTMTLHVEPLTTVELPVELAEQDLQLSEQPEIEPATVQVTLPTRLEEEAEGRSVPVRLDESERGRLEPNTPATLRRVSLVVPEALESRWTKLEPAHVAVTLTIRKQTDTVVQELIPVELGLSPLLAQQYDFALSQEDYYLRDVELTGPADVLQRIKEGGVTVKAVLHPTTEQVETAVSDGEPTPITITPKLNLPPDVTVTSLLPDVPVTVRRR